MARDKKSLGKKLKSPRRTEAPSGRSSEAKSRPARGRSGKSQQTRVTKLARELGDALQRQSATAEILKVIASSRSDVQPVFDVIVQTSRELCRSQASTIFILRERKFHVVAFSGVQTELLKRMKDHPISIDQKGSALARAAREKCTIHIPNTLEDPEFVEGGPISIGGPRATLSVPLMRDGEVIGGITLRQSYLTPYTPRQIEAIETFASQAVIAIENVRLFDEVQARTRDLSEALTYQTGSGNILSVIASSPTDVGPVLKAIVESACELCDALDAIVLLGDGDSLRNSAHHGPIPLAMEERWPISRKWVAGRAFLDRKSVHVHDMFSAEGDEFPDTRERARRTGARTYLCVPLVREGKSIGAIVLRRTEVYPFSDKQIALLQTFADQAVIAIGNVRLFEQVQERTRELSKSLDELRTAQDRLIQTEKLASLGQLTAGIAHEIKNPLNFVNNFSAISVELIDEMQETVQGMQLDEDKRTEMNQLAETLRGNLDKVVQHGKRADAIVKNMLLHSRQGSGEHRPVDVNALVEESLNLAYHGARAEKAGFSIAFQRDLDPSVGMADVYPQEITRVLLNLISNGFYATTKRKAEAGDGFEPMLSATTKNLGDKVEIRIRDNGTGIPDEVKEKIFDPFFTTKPSGEGTGLGLSMSHDIIVKQHGGSIDVATEPGVFTEFKIVLPRASQM
jgi:two-component system, NtrC family, sensor kinase